MAKNPLNEVTRWVRVNPTRKMQERGLTGAAYVEVDINSLGQLLGSKAALSKGKKAVECGGLVRVTWHDDDRDKAPPLPEKALE